MKPDGVDTAAVEPMEALNAGPAVEVAPVGEAQDQALPATQTEATNKTGKDKPVDPKAKTKAPAKTKTTTTGTKASTTSSRPTTGQSRLTNGAQKSQANGVTKKTTTAGLEKKTLTTAAPKKTTASAPTTKTPTKVAEKKPVGTTRPTSAPANGVKTTGAAQAIKKAPAAPANGLKSKPKTTAPATRPATAPTTKTSTTGSPKPDKTPVAKTTRSAGPAPAARSSPAAHKPGTPVSASKTSTAASRPTTATPKTPSTTAKPSPAKTTAPSAARTPTPKTTTPVKKDVSKQSSTPAAKKPTSSPLTRPAPTKTTKSDTPKPASTVKAESASKKSTTPSKVADVKTGKPKESKAASSKEVSASPKTTGNKSTTKTSSPKKAVGSSTPMPLKGGPKASRPADAAAKEAEKKDVVPAVVAATTAAVAVVSVLTSEATPEDSAIACVSAATEDASEDQFIQANPAASEVKLEDSFTTLIPASSEDFKENSKEMDTNVATTIEAPEYTVTPVIPHEETPEDSVTPFSPEETPEDPIMSVIPPTSDEVQEVQTLSPVISSEETPEEVTTPVILPTSYEAREETVSPVIPYEEIPEDVTTSAIRPTFYEAREETVSPVISAAFEETHEDLTTSFNVPTTYEAREETISPVISAASEETPEDVTTAVIPPTSYEAPEESFSPVIPPAFAEAPEETTAPFIPPTSYRAPEEKASPVTSQAFEEEPEDTITPVISPTTDEVEPIYAQDTPQIMDTYKDDNAMSQLVAEIESVSLEDPVPVVSPLGTTVLSPPSSPTGPPSMPVELPSSAPFLGLQGPAESWVQSSSQYPSSATIENEEQYEERQCDEESEEEDEKDQDDTQMPSAAENVIEDFDLMSSSGGDHIKNAIPVSPLQDREEAVEKAEEEINEDNDDEEEEEEEKEEEEEEEEEEQVKEFGIKESEPQTEKEVDLKKGVLDFASSDWGMMQSDDMYSSDKHDSEVTSPFNAEDSCSANETGDFIMTEADREQPFTGPPGIQSFGSEDEEEDEEEEQLKKEMDLALEHDDEHHKQQKELEEEDEDIEMVHRGMDDSALGVSKNDGNEDEDDEDYREESHLDLNSIGHTVSATSMPLTAAWSNSNPFSDPWAQPPSVLSESNLSASRLQDPDTLTKFPADPDTTTAFSAEPETPPRSPAEAFLDMSPPLIQASKPQPDLQEETGSSVQVESGILAPPAIGMSQSSTLSGTALAAHSSSETSTPEELRDYDSSSGVESRSDKQQTPVPAMQADIEQDLGIHLERGDGEEEEAETLPADEVLGEAATAPASVPSSPSTSGDEASDTEGEMQINDPDVAVDDNATDPHNLAALEEDEEAPEHIGEEDGDTPQSANSVASYGFDCSASISNAHSMAESCGKSPGIFSLENEEQLPEEAKDPSFIKELTLPAATAYSDDLLGCPVDLLPISEPTERDAGFDEHYMLCSKTDPGAMEEMDPESPMHLSPQHGDDSDGQPPYYSAICDKTDNFLAGKSGNTIQTGEHQLSLENGNYPRLTQELNDNNYLAPLPNTHRQLQQPLPRISVQHVDVPPRVPPTSLMPNVQLRRLEHHQLQLRHIRQRQEQERLQRLCLEEERQRQEQQRALERQRRELLQLQLQQQQQEHRLRRQLLQRQLEMEQQQRLRQQVKGPSSGLCTIYEAMETSEEEEEDAENQSTGHRGSPKQMGHSIPTNGNLRRPPPQELDWNTKLDMVQQLINQALLLTGEDGCQPLLYLPGQGGGILSPLESSLWPHIMSHFDCTAANVASVSSYSPNSQDSSPQGDWTVVELETHH
ncbi:histone-lysine N-methyltransferase SETD1B [Puntigrus tetrazona]|uniref:histone-lysine N-methyltransferase SETD1B n=1 Tax=Puntigrus tetrazona TaxID=1606681 RepID=UPI001C8A69C6|nr:histone-lysine N-methyltransferase SETD1B [Puntigrus tetrazona]